MAEFLAIPIVLCGHSFITRLQTSTSYPNNNMQSNFRLSQANIVYVSRGGKNFQELFECDWDTIMKSPPQIIYIELGTNDLDSRTPVATFTNDILTKAEEMIEIGVKLVIFGEILERNPSTRGRPSTRKISLNIFNQKVKEHKQQMKSRLEDSTLQKKARRIHPNIWHWDHHYITASVHPMISSDGVHPTPEGLEKLYKSIRGALLQGIKHIAPH